MMMIIIMKYQGEGINKRGVWVGIIWLINITAVWGVCTVGTNNCNSCANANDCRTCDSGYGLDTSGLYTVCTACTPVGCIQCPNNPNVCTSCNAWYRLNGINCQSCSDVLCQRCPSHASTCTVCNYYYRVTSAATCQRCSDFYCRSCNSSPTVCTLCYDGYGVSANNTCVACTDPNCEGCWRGASSCETCVDGYGVRGGACVTCNDANCQLCNDDSTNCTQCALGYGVLNRQCVSCVYGNCLACRQYNASFCLDCRPGYRVSPAGTCQMCSVSRCAQCPTSINVCTNCTIGYGLNGSICSACAFPCRECDGTDFTSCTTCLNQYYFDGSSCRLCMYQCLQCDDGSTCNRCNTTYYVDGASQCTLCPINCISCVYHIPSASPSCTACENNYGLSRYPPYSCPEICGDLLAYQTPCDYQTGNQYDGCDDYCDVEYGFVCNKTGYVAVCSYENETTMEITSLVRDPFANSFTLKVNIWPPLYVFRTSDLKSVFKMSNPIFTITSITFEYPASQLTVKVDFSQSYFNQQVVLEFVPNPLVDQRYFATPGCSASIMTKLFHYSDMTLKSSMITPYLCYIILVLGYLSAILGLPFKRLAGLEAIIVCQVSMLTRVLLNSYFLSPFSVASILQYSVGIHLHLFTMPKTVSRLLLYEETPAEFKDPPQYQGFNFDQFMLSNNFNIFFSLQLLPFLFFLVPFLIIRCMNCRLATLVKGKDQTDIAVMKSRISTVNRVRQLSMQVLMYFGLFNLANFVFCCGLFFKNNAQYTEITSLVILAIGAAIYVVTYILFWFDPDPFDYFRYSFKKQPLAMVFFFFYSFALVSSMALLVLMSAPWPPLIPMGCLFIFVVAYQPYRQLRQNIRSAFNILVILSCFSVRLFVNSAYSEYIQVNDNAFLFSFVNIILLLLVTITAAVFVIYHIVYICCIKPKEELNEKEKVMCELEQIDVRQQMKTLENKDTVFNKLLGPRFNVMDFSNNLINSDNKTSHGLKSDRREQVEQLDQAAAVSKKVRKELEKEKILKEYDSTKSSIEKRIEYINELKYNMETEQVELTKEQQEENKKLIYAMEVLAEENTWVRLKNAKDYTEKKMKEQTANTKAFLQQYDNIS